MLDRGDGDHREAAASGSLRHLDRDGGQAADAEDDHHVRRLELEVGEDRLGQPLDALDEHRLSLTIGADDLRVERHRELHDRVEARVRPVAREHLLDGDARVARAEEMDEPPGSDCLRAQAACLRERVGLCVLDPAQ